MVGVRTLFTSAMLLLAPAHALLGKKKKGKQKMVLVGDAELGEREAAPLAPDSAAAAAGQGQEEQGEAQGPEHEAPVAEGKGADRTEDGQAGEEESKHRGVERDTKAASDGR